LDEEKWSHIISNLDCFTLQEKLVLPMVEIRP